MSWSRSSSTRSSASGPSRPTAAPATTRKLPRIATFSIEPRGPFTLASAARFIEGWPPSTATTDDQSVELRFLVDDWSGPAAVTFTQEGTTVHATVEADHAERALEQAQRVLSLDHDGTGYDAIEDPIVRKLQQASGFLRPVLFHSPYESAAWAILSTRTGYAQAAAARDRLSRDGIFPSPRQLLEVQDGLQATKLERLHGIAEAALAGKLDAEHLRSTPDPRAELQDLPGIGPFWAALIHLRAVGPTDVVAEEPRLVKAVEARYHRPLSDVSVGWRPFRTWVSVLIRANA